MFVVVCLLLTDTWYFIEEVSSELSEVNKEGGGFVQVELFYPTCSYGNMMFHIITCYNLYGGQKPSIM